eukprot:3181206-Rhodomonas_salina.1
MHPLPPRATPTGHSPKVTVRSALSCACACCGSARVTFTCLKAGSARGVTSLGCQGGSRERTG